MTQIRPPQKWRPEGRILSLTSMGFGPCETKAAIRAFARAIFGRVHIILWIVDDLLGDYRYARVWHGLSFHLIQVDLLYADGELFGGKRKLERLYQRHLRESGEAASV